MTILRILGALLALNILVTLHEFGHFIVAKLMGVKVNEFAIGMGPKLLKWGKGETAYTIRALPIGGFCAMEGEDEGAPTPSALGGNADRDGEGVLRDDSRSFATKKVWQRVLIVVAGAAMNLLLGFVLLLAYMVCCRSLILSITKCCLPLRRLVRWRRIPLRIKPACARKIRFWKLTVAVF